MEDISTIQVVEMLEMIAQELENAKERLGELDSKAGDGDLGISMELGAQALNKLLPDMKHKDIGSVFTQCGIMFNKAAPSTMGTLIATAFLAAGKVTKGKKELTPKDIIDLTKAATDGIMTRGKANLGDKTILDALIPAGEVLTKEIEEGNSLAEAVNAATLAAASGVEATIEMQAQAGRASWLGERSRGFPDGGAVVCHIVFQAITNYLLNN
jgi:dihydroxyacetone kinase-like protein